jgi:hypothetical protein
VTSINLSCSCLVKTNNYQIKKVFQKQRKIMWTRLALVALLFICVVRSQLCGEYSAGDPRVCHGRGTCIATNTCNCTSSSYNGALCEQYYSNFYPYDTPSSFSSALPVNFLSSCSDASGTTFTRCLRTTPTQGNFSQITLNVPSGSVAMASQLFSGYGTELTYVVYSENSVFASGLLSNNSTFISVTQLQENAVQTIILQVYVSGTGSSNSVSWAEIYFEPMDNMTFCGAGYTGANCSTYTCGGYASQSPSACSAQGTCIGYNTCICNNDYTGSNCELPVCYGRNASDPLVCNGLGKCISNNTCICGNGTNVIDAKCTPLRQDYTGIAIGVAIAIGILLFMCMCSVGLFLLCSCIRKSANVTPSKWRPPTPKVIKKEEFFDLKTVKIVHTPSSPSSPNSSPGGAGVAITISNAEHIPVESALPV